jgi:hypothetical protein
VTPTIFASAPAVSYSLYSDILGKVVSREVIRIAERSPWRLAEWQVARAYGGQFAPPSVKSWDGEAHGRRLQVKARLIAAVD